MVPKARPDGLDVADGFVLPPEVVVSKQAILAMSGAGKSNAAVVLAEQMYDAGYPWVAIDPKGDWWGVRIDGTGPGLPIPVLGGEHGDVALDPSSGALVARMVAEQRLTCVLDVSDFGRQEMFRFLADFAEALLRVNRDPLHVFAEESDDYLPQQARDKGQLPRCLGAWQRLIKRGRQRGIGSTLVTQRSSAVNKDALNMTDTLIAMRTTAPLDRKAIEGWVDTHGLGRDLVNTLPGLADGEAWVWSPQKLRLTEQIRFHRRRTYDSGATPDLKAPRPGAAHMTEVDLDALKLEMADTIERAAQDDPVRLHARITELERQVNTAHRNLDAERTREPEIRMVPAVYDAEAAEYLHNAVDPDEVREALDRLTDGIRAGIDAYADRMRAAVRVLLDSLQPGEEFVSKTYTPMGGPTQEDRGLRATVSAPMAPDIRDAYRLVANAAGGFCDEGAAERLSKAERAILVTLHQAAIPLDAKRIARLAGYTPDTGGIKNAFSSLRTRGFIERGNPVEITDAGRALVADAEPLPSGHALLEHWKAQGKIINGKAGAAILDVLDDAYPESLTTHEAAERAGYTPDTGGVKNALSRLRVLGLVVNVGSGVVRLSDDLVDHPRF